MNNNNSIKGKVEAEAIAAVEAAFAKGKFTYPESYCELYETGAYFGYNLATQSPTIGKGVQSAEGIPQEILDKIQKAAKEEEIYEPKYGGKDHSGYDTLMKYEVNPMLSECFEKGAIFLFSLLQHQPNTNTVIAEPVEDLQDQVRKHISAHDLFDWHEALTENEMILLENLLLTFFPLCPPGSIGFEKGRKFYGQWREQNPIVADDWISVNERMPAIGKAVRWRSDLVDIPNEDYSTEYIMEYYAHVLNSLEWLDKSTWINVNDSVPVDDSIVQVFAPECYIIGSVLNGAYYSDTKTWTVYDFGDSKLDEKVTHWKPLPQPPKQITHGK